MWDDFFETQTYRDFFRGEYKGHNFNMYEKEKPVAESQEIPKKELTPEEKFEELKNNIRKKNEIQRKPKKNIVPRIDLVTITAIIMLLVIVGGIIISKGVIQ